MKPTLENLSIGDLIGALATRLQESSNLHRSRATSDVVQAIAVLESAVAGVGANVVRGIGDAAAAQQDVLEQVQDLRSELVKQNSLLYSLRESSTSSGDNNAKDAAIHALILADEQFDPLLVAADDQLEPVVRGQRNNLRLALSALAVQPIDPVIGAPLQVERHRSASQTDPTDDAALHERVSRVVQSGWEHADGRLVKHALVRVYVYDPVDAPAAASPTQGPGTCCRSRAEAQQPEVEPPYGAGRPTDDDQPFDVEQVGESSL